MDHIQLSNFATDLFAIKMEIKDFYSFSMKDLFFKIAWRILVEPISKSAVITGWFNSLSLMTVYYGAFSVS